MADINPKKIGDITYTQEPFWRVISLPILKETTVTKGKLVTINGEGRLIVISGTTVTNGIFQPLATATAGTVDDVDFVQVATMGSRILMKAPANVTVGNRVSITGVNDTVVVSTARDEATRLGVVFEIYTRDSSSKKKQKTGAGDLVVVETGMF